MHAFMATILLRFAGLDELGEDAQTNPPGGKGGESGQGLGGERNTVVGPDPVGEAVFFEEAGEHYFCARNSGGMEALATDEVAAEVIGDGEGKAIDAVSGFELFLEISAPKIVGCEYGIGGFAGMSDPASAAGSGDHTVSFEDIADGGTAWKIPIRMTTVNDFDDLFGTPIGVLSSQIKQRFNDVRVSLIGEMMRYPREVFEGAWPVFSIAFNPFVTGLARDIIAITKFGKRKPLLRKISDESNFLVHR
jgi:hypothetical protein